MSEMETEQSEQGKCGWFRCSVKEHAHGHGCGRALYGLGFLGALVYYLTTATSLLAGVLGVVRAILWPAFLVYGVLKFIGA